MKSSAFFIVVSLSLSAASQLPPFSKAALAAYTPQINPCPSDFSLVREANAAQGKQALSDGERAYIKARRRHVLPHAFRSYVKNLISTGQDIPPTLKHIFHGKGGASPTHGMAFSGGAFRAALFGAGAINLFDGRNETSRFAGFGGILQGAAYMAGLSGGGWFITAFSQANMPSVPDLVFGPTTPPADNAFGGFNIAFDVLTPFDNDTLNQGFIEGLILQTRGKAAVGNAVSLSEVFGMSLARHFVNGTNAGNLLDFDCDTHGTGHLFSSIAKVPAFETHNLPFPIVLSTLLSKHGNPDDIIPGNIVPLSNTKFEYNVYEFGSYDPSLGAFIPMQNLGTINESSCVVNFDQIPFVLGSTGDVFPQINASAQLAPSDPAVLEFQASSAAFQQLVPQRNVRVDAALIPNAFAGRADFSEADEELLSLADGGLDGANLPIQPLLVPARGLQAIIVIDPSADTPDNFATGKSMIAESKRVALFPGAYKFPQIPPTPEEFIAQNLNTQPTFFGCDEAQDVPLILYFPNGAPPPGEPALTNASTNQLSFSSPEQVQAIIDQAGKIVQRGRPQNGDTRDPLFPLCIACALAERERSRLGLMRDVQCDTCFTRYCYKPDAANGTQATYGGAVVALADAASAPPSSDSDSLAWYGPVVVSLLAANLLISAGLVVLGMLMCLRKRKSGSAHYTALDS